MLLVLNGSRTDGNIGEQVFDIAPVLRIEHLVCSCEMRCFRSMQVEFSHGNQAFHHIRSLQGIGLGSDSLVAITIGSRLVGIDTGDNDYSVLHPLLNFCQTTDIVHNGIFGICGARSDNT